jgi:hypothetical protein
VTECSDGDGGRRDVIPHRERKPLRSNAPVQPPSTVTVIRGIVVQLLLVAAAAGCYFMVRGLTEGAEAPAVDHAHSILDFERTVRLDFEAGLQRVVLESRACVTVANWIYMWGHWPVIGPSLLVLYIVNRRDYIVLRNAMFLSGAVGLVIFAMYPVAPPRLLAPDAGYIDTVTTWSNSYRVLQPPALVNKYAAMPSFHVGWNLLVGITMIRSFRQRWIRGFAVVLPLLMAFAVVATANHYVLDLVVGVAIALGGLVVSNRLSALAHRRGADVG